MIGMFKELAELECYIAPYMGVYKFILEKGFSYFLFKSKLLDLLIQIEELLYIALNGAPPFYSRNNDQSYIVVQPTKYLKFSKAPIKKILNDAKKEMKYSSVASSSIAIIEEKKPAVKSQVEQSQRFIMFSEIDPSNREIELVTEKEVQKSEYGDSKFMGVRESVRIVTPDLPELEEAAKEAVREVKEIKEPIKEPVKEPSKEVRNAEASKHKSVPFSASSHDQNPVFIPSFVTLVD